ncbi:hypothetical protein BXZ70DRAFT_540857 [Cristinia sonorae]|uniref:Uncharacterized protein n=1 Tax=Cristinia sonorae TaxID=1940300 RepID=A0A8K0UFY6_9AGAR|nr:hypothetical protein BXZ70DRAFT_540857 [Cristinia sonorae]
MASSSSQRPQRARIQTDTFRPRFPLDPFAKLKEPWYVKPERLPAHARQDVILVLGDPTVQELGPLLFSKHLANTLLILASHEPIELPSSTVPTVRILRLKEQLSIEDSGAVRFVSVLEWAERVGKLWRSHGGSGIAVLEEGDDGRDYLFHISSSRLFSISRSTPASPKSSTSMLAAPQYSDATHSKTIPGRQRSSRIFGQRSPRPSLPQVDSAQRPIDAIVNFLPKNTSEKAMLKQAVLVTTISRPFIMSVTTGAGVRPPLASGQRRSWFGDRSTSSVYLPTPPYTHSGESVNTFVPALPVKAHLLHLLPEVSRTFSAGNRSRLVQSLESFLISFAYPASPSKEDAERAWPYLMSVTQLSQQVSSPLSSSSSNSPYGADGGSYTLSELILAGSLDPAEPVPINSNSKRPVSPYSRLTPRAWISGVDDIVLLGENPSLGPGVSITPPSPTTYIFPRPALSEQYDTTSSLASSRTTPRLSVRPKSMLSRETAKRTIINLDDPRPNAQSLPTPPDSEESVSDHSPTPSDFEQRRRSASFPGTQSGAAEQGSKRKGRWKFWKAKK